MTARHLAALATVVLVMPQWACSPAPADDAPPAADLPTAEPTDPGGDAGERGPVLDLEAALSLAAMPLACLDRPHAPPRERLGYLDDRTTVRRSDYETTRAFYGCYDWHSAVNSTWALVRLLKEIPDLPIAQLIHEKLDDHLTEDALQGEMEFFESNRSFERPYGWAWYLALLAELRTWEDSAATVWADRMAPLGAVFVERMTPYLENLDYPSRVGVHRNTAFALSMMLDAARALGDQEFEATLEAAAMRFYNEDVDCPTDYEPSGSDFLSPCLEEARLMGLIMPPAAYAAWLTDFLPPIDSDAFRPLTVQVDVGEDDETLEDINLMGAKSHLIGLAVIRAEALSRIASSLPADDPRVAAFRALAARHASWGFDAMYDAAYTGSHWIGSFAVRYLAGLP